ncbi:MAG: translation initiation factor IF-2 subunit beta [Candidatus Aenigmarchaeota archaeon]|nr:translation initiation factor IF-2 subunit beta [Candidatus Aenigmarchaeota archaeon]
MDYEALLKRGMEKIPEDVRTAGRFHIARPEVEKAGAKSIITNFLEIAGGLDREPEHLLKFLLKQLATKGEVEGQRLVVLGVFSADAIEKKLELYVKQYVTCPKCGRPDSKLVKEHEGVFLRCDACGNKAPVPKV